MAKQHNNHDPSLARALGEVARTVRFQLRPFLVWLFIIIFTGAVIALAINAGSFSASLPEIDENIDLIDATVFTIEMDIASDGRVFINDKLVNGLYRPLPKSDEIRYKVLDKPDRFIDQVIVRAHFEAPIPVGTKIQSIAVHGVDQTSEKQLDESTIEYEAVGIGPSATYTIVSQLPKGTINRSQWQNWLAALYAIPPLAWIALAALMPVSTFLALVAMFWPRLKTFVAGNSVGTRAEPPKTLPPAIVGILVNGRVSAREIAATLLDLANRGYISVYNKGKGRFSFAKRKPWQGLNSFELTLLMQMFEPSHYKSSELDIESSVGLSLFSSKVSNVYVAMYDAATADGYFEKNPRAIHSRYRFAGLCLFFLGLIAFTASVLLRIQPSYIVFFFAGLMTMALVIIFSADQVPLHTKAGQAARLEWLAFGNYLAATAPLGYVEGAKEVYEQFLPYAVVLKKEIPWANRFRSYPFRVPDWYASTEDSIAIEDFANGLYQIVGSVAELLNSTKEPTVQ